LINEVVEQRGKPNSNPTNLSSSQEQACVKYALQQTSLNVPAEFAAPGPPKGETATTSTITVPPPTSK
jgi:hypothetical protein